MKAPGGVGLASGDALAAGTFLTVLGFGTGNVKDSKMEKLAILPFWKTGLPEW